MAAAKEVVTAQGKLYLLSSCPRLRVSQSTSWCSSLLSVSSLAFRLATWHLRWWWWWGQLHLIIQKWRGKHRLECCWTLAAFFSCCPRSRDWGLYNFAWMERSSEAFARDCQVIVGMPWTKQAFFLQKKNEKEISQMNRLKWIWVTKVLLVLESFLNVFFRYPRQKCLVAPSWCASGQMSVSADPVQLGACCNLSRLSPGGATGGDCR